MGTLFSLEIGTEGSGPERWSIWLPVRLVPSYQLQPGSVVLRDQSISFGTRDEFTIIEVRTFDREVEAQDFVRRLRGALLLWAIEKKIGLLLPQDLQELQLFNPPAPGIDNPNFGAICKNVGWQQVDGSYDVDRAAILPQHKRLVRFATGQARVFVTAKADQTAAALFPILELANIGGIQSTARLSLAAETYLSSLFPIGVKARLLELTTVLEILAPTPDVGPEAEHILSAALAEAKHSRNALGADHPEIHDIDRLVSRIGSLRSESIKESLRIWTRSVSTRLSGWDPDKAAADVSSHYDVRSQLLHSGSAPDSQVQAALQWLTEFVPAALALLIREAAIAV